MKKFIERYIKPWFFSSDDPTRIKAPYVISFTFLGLTIVSIVIHLSMKIWQFERIKDLWNIGGIKQLQNIKSVSQLQISLIPLITVLIGTAGLFIGLYNWGKNKKNASSNAPQQTYKGTGKDDGPINNNET